MASAQAVWGIDVGRCALTAVKLRPVADGGVELVATDYVEHAKILSQPDADRNELIAAALEKFLSRNDISRDEVVVSVPGQHTLARFTKLPPVAPKRIPDIVRYEADQQIPFDMDEVIWDYQTFQQEDLPDIEVGIFAMKRELIREHLLHFEQASIEPIAVQPAPLAVYNAAGFDGVLGDETTILLDIGAENTDLVIATSYGLWTRTIPIGGNSCTDALVKSFKLSFAKAENLKRTAETSKYRRQIFQAMRPVFADLVQELQRSIGFYSSTHRDANITKVFGVGNAFKLPGLQKYLQQNLSLTVECPEDFAKAKAAGSSDEEFKEQHLSFWSAYGLALHGLDLSTIKSNLLPTEIAKQVVWRKKKPAFAAAAACLVLAGGLIWFRQSADMRALAANSEGVDAVSVSLEQAPRIIDNGPSRSLSLRAQAKSVQDAGQKLKREHAGLAGGGETERATIEELIRLQGNKALAPKIMQAIHAAVPIAQGSMGTATTQAELAAAVAASGVARDQREQVFIRSINLQYLDDVNNPLWPDALNKAAMEAINDPEGEQPGIKMVIVCTTPHGDGLRFVAERFADRVLAAGRQPDMGFYIDRVHIIEGTRAQLDDERNTSAFGRIGTGGRGSTKSAATAADTGVADPELHDPVTNESFRDDWQFEIWADAILEDLPPSEDEEEETP